MVANGQRSALNLEISCSGTLVHLTTTSHLPLASLAFVCIYARKFQILIITCSIHLLSLSKDLSEQAVLAFASQHPILHTSHAGVAHGHATPPQFSFQPFVCHCDISSQRHITNTLILELLVSGNPLTESFFIRDVSNRFDISASGVAGCNCSHCTAATEDPIALAR